MAEKALLRATSRCRKPASELKVPIDQVVFLEAAEAFSDVAGPGRADTLNGLEGIVRASQRDLEAVDGVGAVRAREIREGLRRLQEHNLVDRYLQL